MLPSFCFGRNCCNRQKNLNNEKEKTASRSDDLKEKLAAKKEKCFEKSQSAEAADFLQGSMNTKPLCFAVYLTF